MNGRRRTAALLEVMGVYLAGPLVTRQLVGVLGLRPVNPFGAFTRDITDAQLMIATRQMLALLALQYVGYFLLIVPINWWHRRSGPAAYGFTRAGLSWRALLVAGVGTVATVTLLVSPASVLLLFDSIYHLNLGETAPWRQAFFDTSWRRWEFWLFSGVMSWAFIPVVEELLFRGYCQRRLAEDWGDAPAILATAFLFTFAHGQYLVLNTYNVLMVASLLILAIGFGTVFAWTRSLIPAIVAHAIINVPMTPRWAVVLLIGMAGGGLIAGRRAAAVVRRVFSNSTLVACVALSVAGTAWVIAAQNIEPLVFVGGAMVVLAVGLEAIERRERTRERGAASV